MSVVTEEMVEAAACRIALHVGCGDPSDFRDCNPKTCDCRAAASDALAAVAPIIAAQERERCAELAETHEWFVGGIGTKAPGSGEANAIAAAIRALGDAT